METEMHEYHVSLEVAKLLKQAGFDWKTFSHWTESDINNPDFKFSGLSNKPILYDGYTPIDEEACVGRKKDWNNYNNECPLIYHYSAPTLDIVQRWLREVKGYHISVFPETTYKEGIMYNFSIYKEDYDFNANHIYTGQTVKTYEEAQEAGIKKALEIILKEGE